MSVIAEHLSTGSITKEYLESKGLGKREAEEFLEKLMKMKKVKP
jgi:hypothetical protein